MKKPLVLIVDDDPDILLLIRNALAREGFRTSLAGDGETALTRAREQQPDAVVLDLMMPLLDGWTVIEAMRSLPRCPALIVVSAKSQERDRSRALRLGADAHIEKPFDFEQLSDAINDALRRSPEERERHRREMLDGLLRSRSAS